MRNSWRDRLAYHADRILVKRSAFMLALATWGLCQVAVSGTGYWLVWYPDLLDDPRDLEVMSVFGWVECVWQAWTFMADGGTHARVWLTTERLVSCAITLGGIFYFSSILGVCVDIIREKMDGLRQGKSRIIESNHTLILGWTEKTVHIIEELCKANESEGGGVVAVLAQASKSQMELEFDIQLPVIYRRGTRVIFRSGSPLVMGDLLRVSVHSSRAIIILSSTGNADSADADTLRTMLSLRSLYDQLQGHVIAEVRDIDNEPLVRLVGGGKVETLVSHDVIGRLMLMSVRQPGLAKVYEALLGFSGDEFYMAEWPELVGTRFGNLAECFSDAIPIGVLSADFTLVLNPDYDHEVIDGDKIIVIAEDNDTYKPHLPVTIETGCVPEPHTAKQTKEKILFCGWRRDVRDILQQLDRIVCRGSEVHIMTHCVPLHLRDTRLMEDGLDLDTLENLVLVHHHGNTSVRRKLELLPIETYSSCMIFADEAYEQDTLRADSHSLATLLLIRDIQTARGTQSTVKTTTNMPATVSSTEKRVTQLHRTITDLSAGQKSRCPIICEVLDPHTQKTISNNRHLSLTSDFCQTNKLIAQVLAMVAEDRTVSLLFDELLGHAGCAMAVVPSSRYTYEGEALSFWTLSKRAAQMGECLVGYQMRNSIDKTVLNPPNKNEAYTWDRYDLAVLRGETAVPRGHSRGDSVTKSLRGFVELENRTSLRDKAGDRSSLSKAKFSSLGSDEGGYYRGGLGGKSGSMEFAGEGDFRSVFDSEIGGSSELDEPDSPKGANLGASSSLDQRLQSFMTVAAKLAPEVRCELSGMLGALAQALAAEPVRQQPVTQQTREGPPGRSPYRSLDRVEEGDEMTAEASARDCRQPSASSTSSPTSTPTPRLPSCAKPRPIGTPTTWEADPVPRQMNS